MYRCIIPRLVSLESKIEQLKGSYYFDSLSFYDQSTKKFRFHYHVVCKNFKIPEEFDFISGYYFFKDGFWYYKRRLLGATLKMCFDPKTKTFWFNKSALRIPFEIGSILPAGKHLADMITLDLELKNFVVIRGCAYERKSVVYAFIKPSNNGKTSLVLEQLKQGAKYIAEDVLVIDPSAAKIYPTAARAENYGRRVNKPTYELAKKSSVRSAKRLETINISDIPGGIQDTQNKAQLVQAYKFLNGSMYADNKFIRSFVFYNKLASKLQENNRAPNFGKVSSVISSNLDRRKVNQDHWNELGKNYEDVWLNPAKKQMNDQEMRFVTNSILIQKPKILDIGFGTGRIIDAIISKDSESKVYGIDIAQNMLKHSQKRFQGATQVKRLRQCDISKDKIPFNIKFDVITAIRVIKYNKNWEEVVTKLIDQLADDGKLIFSMTNKNSINRFGRYSIDYERTTKSQIKKLANRSDVRLKKIDSFTRFPDVIYGKSSNKVFVKILVLLEKLLQLLPNGTLGRELFIVLEKAGT